MQDIDRRFIGRMGSKMGFFAFAYAEMKKRGLGYEFPHSMEYWEEALPDLQDLFRPGIIIGNSVGVHIRRGDFLRSGSHASPLPLRYYQHAMSMFPPSTEFLVFAEDNQDPFVQAVIDIAQGRAAIHLGDEIDAFNRMAGCKHNIIANSSFSYWAALINPNRGQVAYPSIWANNGWAPKVPTDWIKIECQ